MSKKRSSFTQSDTNDQQDVETEENEDLGKTSTFKVNFTRFELVHLRDLFNVKIPPEMMSSVSESLAEATNRPLLEKKLWQKLVVAFEEAQIPLDDEAPDYTLLPTSAPELRVFQLEPTDQQLEEEE
jgi:hypothetical protein